MPSSPKSIGIKDNGGRRRLSERRQYAGSTFFPERRGTRFRRSGTDRRWHPVADVPHAHEKRNVFLRKPKDDLTP